MPRLVATDDRATDRTLLGTRSRLGATLVGVRATITLVEGRAALAAGRVTVRAVTRRYTSRLGVSTRRRHVRGLAALTIEFGLRRATGHPGAQHRLRLTARCDRPTQRRLSERTTDRSHRPTGRGCGVLESGELPTEIGDGGVRSILDARSQHRRDENRQPSGGDDEEDELSHVFFSFGSDGVEYRSVVPQLRE